MTSLVPHANGDTPRDWIGLLPAAVELAKVVAGTEFVPKGMRENPAPIAAAILYGDEVGLGPMVSLAKINVIDGRPTLAAEAQRGLILAAGHDIWLEESTISRCTWAGRRAGAEMTSRVTWTIDDARRANLAGKQNWRGYPRQMLSARASAELARAIFADVIGGLAATEEVEDLPAEGEVLALPAAPTSATRRRRRSGPASAAVATASTGEAPLDVPLPPLPGEEGEPMGDGQRKRMMALFREKGIAEGQSNEARAQRMAYVNLMIDREVDSSAQLTSEEADTVIAALEGSGEAQDNEQAVEPPDPDEGQLL